MLSGEDVPLFIIISTLFVSSGLDVALFIIICMLYVCVVRLRQDGLVVGVSASHAVGHGFVSRPGHTKNHHKNGGNCHPARHAMC